MFAAILRELGYVALKRQLALNFLKEYPGEFLTLTAKRFSVFWDGEAFYYQQKLFFERHFFGTFSLLSGLGLLLAMRRRVFAAHMVAAVVLFYPAVYYVTYSHPRYRQAVEPLMLMAIMYLLHGVYQALQSRIWKPSSSKLSHQLS